MTPFVISSGFVDGGNGLDFVINNAPATPNPTGLRVDLQGLMDIRPTLSVHQVDATHVSVAWSSTNTCHDLQASPNANGPWTSMGPGTNPRSVDTQAASVRFFRIAP